MAPRPPLGANPFAKAVSEIEPRLSLAPERYVSPALSGSVTFDYSNNNGRYALGAGDMLFETAWSGGGLTSIHAYTAPLPVSGRSRSRQVRRASQIFRRINLRHIVPGTHPAAWGDCRLAKHGGLLARDTDRAAAKPQPRFTGRRDNLLLCYCTREERQLRGLGSVQQLTTLRALDPRLARAVGQ